MTISTPWRVWLDDARLARVRAALDTLGNQLLALPDDAIPQPPGLVAGLPGVALAHAYLAHAGGGEVHAERCAERLEAAVASADGLAGDGSLARGLAGFGFVLEHLGANEDDDLCADFDGILERDAREPDRAAEVMWGLAGRALYAHERRARPSSHALAAIVVERLLAMAEPQPEGGVAWRSDARFAGPTGVDAAGARAFNLGVAHGTPGIVAALAASDEPRAREAARAGMRWLWSQRFADGEIAFPMVAGGARHSAHGWCYGDEGIGASMYAAARALDDESWQARWL